MNSYSKFPAIAAFQHYLGEEGLDSEDPDETGKVAVPNPPYPTMEYFAPFFQKLQEALVDAGFKGAGTYEFCSPELRATIENADADREEGPEIYVQFTIRDSYLDGIMESVPATKKYVEKSTMPEDIRVTGIESLRVMGAGLIRTILAEFRWEDCRGDPEVDDAEARAMLSLGPDYTAAVAREGIIGFLKSPDGLELVKKLSSPFYQYAERHHSRMSPAGFRKLDPEAFVALVKYWKEQSECTDEQSEKNLVEDIDSEYMVSLPSDPEFLQGVGSDQKGKYKFHVDFSGETAYYDESTKTWISWGFV